MSFNPRPPLLAGDPAPTQAAVFLSQGFNPRPPLLAGDPQECGHEQCAYSVSIHARHCWRAIQHQISGFTHAALFQSTPAIAGGRSADLLGALDLEAVFQSTPAIAGGRSPKHTAPACPCLLFQSTPAIAGGRSLDRAHTMAIKIVSIHARHCWRAIRSQALKPLSWRVFQSTPAIAGGRSSRLRVNRFCLKGFNPRPPLLAGDPITGHAVDEGDAVSIHARHCWRAIRQSCGCPAC